MAQWLRHCTTNRKVAGSFPDGVIGTFHWHKTSGRSMALGLTQSLTEVGSKGGWRVGLTTFTTFMCRLSLKSGSLNLLGPSGPVQACNGTALPFEFYHNLRSKYRLFSWKCMIIVSTCCEHFEGVWNEGTLRRVAVVLWFTATNSHCLGQCASGFVLQQRDCMWRCYQVRQRRAITWILNCNMFNIPTCLHTP